MPVERKQEGKKGVLEAESARRTRPAPQLGGGEDAALLKATPTRPERHSCPRLNQNTREPLAPNCPSLVRA